MCQDQLRKVPGIKPNIFIEPGELIKDNQKPTQKRRNRIVAFQNAILFFMLAVGAPIT